MFCVYSVYRPISVNAKRFHYGLYLAVQLSTVRLLFSYIVLVFSSAMFEFWVAYSQRYLVLGLVLVGLALWLVSGIALA